MNMRTTLTNSTDVSASTLCPCFAYANSIGMTHHVRPLSGPVAAFDPQCRGASYQAGQLLAASEKERTSVEFGMNGGVSFDLRNSERINSKSPVEDRVSPFVEGLGLIPVGGGNEK
jgi:hypothetical protein